MKKITHILLIYPHRSRHRFRSQGGSGDDTVIADGDDSFLIVCPRVRPAHRSRPRFLPQGGEGDDTLTATGTVSYMRGAAGADDSCTLDGVRKVEGEEGSKFLGCEPP